MVLAGPQTTNFFQAAAQMGLTAAARTQLKAEGLMFVDDLGEFDEKSLLQACKNARTADHPVGAKSVSRLTTAVDLVEHCGTAERPLTAANIA